MTFNVALLWKAPEVNPINQKARSIPAFNVINVYGRVFNFSWFGFMIAFWSWYAFPPLLHGVIDGDLHLTRPEVANSNIVALTATLLVRLVAGPLCDRYGPRKTFAGCLLLGAIPTFCAGGVKNATGLMFLRFFIGILGGSFVPCQVWTTAFFDKNVVGTANALTGGFGNAGGGITYFVMPAIYNSLMKNQHMTRHVAWRVSFVVPGILIVTTAVAMLLFCPDTPTGKWSERNQVRDTTLQNHQMLGVVDASAIGNISAEKRMDYSDSSINENEHQRPLNDDKKDILPPPANTHFGDHEAHLTPQQMMDTAQGEIIRKPTPKEIARVFSSPQSWVTGICYFCSFGAELAINSILGSYYQRNFPKLGLQQSGNWAAMFGLVNVVFRPLGGYFSDVAYKASGNNVWAKKILLHTYALITGCFLIAIGVLNPKDKSTMFGLIAGMAFFLDGGNGLNYALVPHVHPHANGVISGMTGAFGNLGGIVFAIVFRYNLTQYGRSMWIIGVMTIGLNLMVCWIKPIPKGQIGGR